MKQFMCSLGTTKKKTSEDVSFFSCAGTATPLELFNWLTNEVEMVRTWNEAIKVFLAQEQPKKALSIRL